MALGPGLGDDPATDRWVVDLLSAAGPAAGGGCGRPRAPSPAWAANRASPPDQVVLTPHAGELARLVGDAPAEVEADAGALAAELAARWDAVLMLKGSPTVIGAPDGRVFLNATGDDALARGGAGDVLTGLIGGLLAQGLRRPGGRPAGRLRARAGRAPRPPAGAAPARVLVREIAAAIGPVSRPWSGRPAATPPCGSGSGRTAGDRAVRVLGIETSCDDTSVALYDSERGVAENLVSSQVDLHDVFGGVVPELAIRAHLVNLLPLVDTPAAATAACAWPTSTGWRSPRVRA